MKAIRLILLFAAASLALGEACAASLPGPVPLPRARPTLKADRAVKPNKAQARGAAPSAVSLLPPASSPATTAAITPPAPAMRPGPAFAMATNTATSPLDLAAVKQAIDLVHKGRRAAPPMPKTPSPTRSRASSSNG